MKGQTDTSTSFEGGGGYVVVGASPTDGGTEVVVNAREWERHARGFVRDI